MAAPDWCRRLSSFFVIALNSSWNWSEHLSGTMLSITILTNVQPHKLMNTSLSSKLWSALILLIVFDLISLTHPAQAEPGERDESYRPTIPFTHFSSDDPVLKSLAADSHGNVWGGGQVLAKVDPHGAVELFLEANNGKEFGFSAIEKVVCQPDGKVIVAGDFIRFRDPASNTTLDVRHLVRFDVDGTLDKSFGTDFALPAIIEMALCEDGRLCVVTEERQLIKLLEDGTIDTSFSQDERHSLAPPLHNPFRKPVLAAATNGQLYSWSNASGPVRLNADGTIDEGFTGEHAPDNVNAMAVQSDGKLILAGDFDIVRLMPDGSVDPSFFVNSLEDVLNDGSAYALAIESSGRILVGGSFHRREASGYSTRGLFRLHADGTPDLTFHADYVWVGRDRVEAIALSGPDIYAAGFFAPPGSDYDDPRRRPLIRIEGGERIVQPPRIVEEVSDRFVAAGDQTVLHPMVEASSSATFQWHKDGVALSGATSRVYRIEETTLDDRGLYQVTISDTLGTVSSEPMILSVGSPNASKSPPFVVRQPQSRDSHIGYSVSFDAEIGGQPEPELQWYQNGQAIPGATSNLFELSSITLLDAGTYWLTASNTEGSVATKQVALQVSPIRPGALDGDFQMDPSISLDIESVIAVQSNDGVLVTDVLSPDISRDDSWLVRFFPSGSLDQSFTFQSPDGTMFRNAVLSVLPDDHIITRDRTGRIARLTPDGQPDPTYSGETIRDWQIFHTVPSREGGLYIFGASGDRLLRRFLPEGPSDPGFSVFRNAALGRGFAVLGDGSPMIADSFWSNEGVEGPFLSHLQTDGSVNQTFREQADLPNYVVDAIAPQPDGKVIFGGSFGKVGGNPIKGLTRLNANGKVDLTFQPKLNTTPPPPVTFEVDDDDDFFDAENWADLSVNAIEIDEDGSIYIGGRFRDVEGVSRPNIARLLPNGALDVSFDPGEGLQLGGPSEDEPWQMPAVHQIELLADGKLYVKGHFTKYDGVPRNGLARIFSSTAGHSVTITDPSLESVLRQAIEKSEGTINSNDLIKLQHLDGARKGIVSLSGIENAVNLRTLDLTANRLDGLSELLELPMLRAVSVAGNRLEPIDERIRVVLDSLRSKGVSVLDWPQSFPNTPEIAESVTISPKLLRAHFTIEGDTYIPGPEFGLSLRSSGDLDWTNVEVSCDLVLWEPLESSSIVQSSPTTLDLLVPESGSSYYRIKLAP